MLNSPTALLTMASFHKALLLTKSAALEDKLFNTEIAVVIGDQASLPHSICYMLKRRRCMSRNHGRKSLNPRNSGSYE